MNSKFLSTSLAVLVLVATASLAQTSPNQGSANPAPAQEQQDTPRPETPAKPNAAEQTPSPQQTPKKVNRADAYFHYTLAHMYEEMVATYGRAEYANKAIDEYRAAIQADPSSDYLNAGLADLYWRTGRIRDAVV